MGENKTSDDVLNILQTQIQDGETQIKNNTYELHFLEEDGNYSKVKSFQDHPSNCAVKEDVTDEIKTVEPPEIVAQHNGTPEKKEQIKDSLTIPKVKEMQKEKQKRLPPKVLQLTPL